MELADVEEFPFRGSGLLQVMSPADDVRILPCEMATTS